MRHGLQTGLGIAGVVLLTVYNLQSFSPAQQLQPGPGMELQKCVQNYIKCIYLSVFISIYLRR